MSADDNNGASVNEYSVKSTTSDVSSLPALPNNVENYIFVHRSNCNYTNALLQTMHPDIEIVCENIRDFSNVSPYPHSNNQPMLNSLRTAANFVTNKVVSKIKIGLATLLSIPWYDYKNSNFVEIIKSPAYKSNVSINTQDNIRKFFINRNDLIRESVVRPNKQIFTDDQKQKYFNDMLDFYNNSNNYKTTSPYLRSVEEQKRFNEVLGGKRTKKRPKRMRKSTKRKRGTRKRTNKKR